jgi:kynurenine formamidase
LVAAGGVCRIDSLNIDATEDPRGRPVHTTLLGNDIPIIEHLTGLDALRRRASGSPLCHRRSKASARSPSVPSPSSEKSLPAGII